MALVPASSSRTLSSYHRCREEMCNRTPGIISLLTEKTGRIICWGLVLVDSILGTVTALFPQLYYALLHPRVLTGDCATDLIVRTGILWLMFMRQGVACPFCHCRS